MDIPRKDCFPIADDKELLREEHDLQTWWVRDSISDLKGYRQILEQILGEQEKGDFAAFEEGWQSIDKDVSEEIRSDWWHSHFPYYWQQVFVPQFRSSLLLWATAVLEFHLAWVCRTCARASGIEERLNKRGRGSTIQRARALLVNALGFSPEDDIWQEVKSLYEIRNTIAHSVGVVREQDRVGKLAPHLKRYNGIDFDDQGLSLEMTEDSCEAVVGSVSTFLSYLMAQQELLLRKHSILC